MVIKYNFFYVIITNNDKILTIKNRIFTILYLNYVVWSKVKKNYKMEYSFFDSIRSNNKFFGNGLNNDWSIILFKSYCNAQKYNNVKSSNIETKHYGFIVIA